MLGNIDEFRDICLYNLVNTKARKGIEDWELYLDIRNHKSKYKFLIAVSNM